MYFVIVSIFPIPIEVLKEKRHSFIFFFLLSEKLLNCTLEGLLQKGSQKCMQPVGEDSSPCAVTMEVEREREHGLASEQSQVVR